MGRKRREREREREREKMFYFPTLAGPVTIERNNETFQFFLSIFYANLPKNWNLKLKKRNQRRE